MAISHFAHKMLKLFCFIWSGVDSLFGGIEMVCYYYLDNAATTKVLPKVVNAMKPYFSEKYGNPSSAHMFGRKIKDDIDDARQSVANLIGAK